ncbi:MAG TPA: alpha/beta family hydrolase [Ilumatobacteraceae bacterium]
MKTTRWVKGALLFPGAGTDSTHPSLVRLQTALQPLPVHLADFAYRRSGRRAPDKAPVLLQNVRAEAAATATELGVKPKQLVLGGRSMGGRMCSMAVAGDEPALDPVTGASTGAAPATPLAAAGLILMAYPLHPPGKPDNLRVAHLPRITVPCLFISGTRDAFGSPAELEQWTSTIAGPVTHVWLEGKGHDLKGADAAIAAACEAWLLTVR